MLSFTLDANCIIDLEEDRPDGPHIRRLIEANRGGTASVAVAGTMASEKQRDGRYNKLHTTFTERLAAMGLGHLPVLPPMMLWDVTFWDKCLWGSREGKQLFEAIHAIIHPSGSTTLRNPGAEPIDDRIRSKWQNRVLDSMALWCHIHHGRDVFVSRDRCFHSVERTPKLIALGAGRILRPGDALATSLD